MGATTPESVNGAPCFVGDVLGGGAGSNDNRDAGAPTPRLAGVKDQSMRGNRFRIPGATERLQHTFQVMVLGNTLVNDTGHVTDNITA